jgi:hypothetical protein
MEEWRMAQKDYPNSYRQNRDGYWYTVGERTGGYHYGKPLYEIVFDSGYRTEMTSQDIWRNKIKDWGSPSVYGVGIVGWQIARPTKHPLYGTWHGMLERCMGPRRKTNRAYDDVEVDPRWLHFDNFVEDAGKLPGYDLALISSGELQLDKDKLGSDIGKREYGPETCCWLTREEQALYHRKPVTHQGTHAPQSPYRGVHWTDGVWLARPQTSGERTLLGCFHDPLRGAMAINSRFPEYYSSLEKYEIGQAASQSDVDPVEVEAILLSVGTRSLCLPRSQVEKPGLSVTELFARL